VPGGRGMKKYYIMNNNHYNKKLKTFARDHRNHSTHAEIRLWRELLRNKQMKGFSFLRQRPIDNYIADFFCKELRLIIETDGGTHQYNETIKKDIKKQHWLEKSGYTVLRFDDDDVRCNLEWVKERIEEWIEKSSPVTLSRATPLSKGDDQH
jgi:very-short-patch-repair endonuclease